MKRRTEACPICGETSAVHSKLILIDEAWVSAPGKEARLKYFTDLRVDDIKPENLREPPLEQFVDGFHCDRCNKSFLAEEELKENRRRHK